MTPQEARGEGCMRCPEEKGLYFIEDPRHWHDWVLCETCTAFLALVRTLCLFL